jgi:SOS-response transcriptional repressor LexA
MLTKRQKQALDYLTGEIARTGGIAPTRKQMSAVLGTTLSNASRLISILEEKGAIRRMRNRARAIEVVTPATSVIGWLKWNNETKQLEPWGRR